MRLLLISLDYPPSFSSTGVLMRQLAVELHRRGTGITIITSVAESGTATDRRAGWTDEGGIRVLRIPLLPLRNTDSAAGRLLLFALFNLLSLVTALCVRGVDIVLTTSPPFTSGVVSRLVGALKGIPSIYIVHDFQSEAYVQYGVLRRPWLIALFRRLERFACAANTRVVVIAESFAAHLRSQNVPAERIVVIPNFVDTDEIRPLSRENAFAVRAGLTDRFVVMHAGSIAFRHGLQVAVEAAAYLRDEPDILIVVIGEGSKRRELEERMAALALPNVLLLPFQSREDLPEVRASADVHLITLRREMTRHSVPCKVYEIMASGRPFLASLDAGSEIDLIVQRTGTGIVVEPESPAALAGAIRRMFHERQVIERMGATGRTVAVVKYSVQAAAAAYESLIRELVAYRT